MNQTCISFCEQELTKSSDDVSSCSQKLTCPHGQIQDFLKGVWPTVPQSSRLEARHGWSPQVSSRHQKARQRAANQQWRGGGQVSGEGEGEARATPALLQLVAVRNRCVACWALPAKPVTVCRFHLPASAPGFPSTLPSMSCAGRRNLCTTVTVPTQLLPAGHPCLPSLLASSGNSYSSRREYQVAEDTRLDGGRGESEAN